MQVAVPYVPHRNASIGLACSGAVAGSLAWEELETRGAHKEGAGELRACMPSFISVASARDVVGYDGHYLAHRCSCHDGMNGSPLRLAYQP